MLLLYRFFLYKLIYILSSINGKSIKEQEKERLQIANHSFDPKTYKLYSKYNLPLLHINSCIFNLKLGTTNLYKIELIYFPTQK